MKNQLTKLIKEAVFFGEEKQCILKFENELNYNTLTRVESRSKYRIHIKIFPLYLPPRA